MRITLTVIVLIIISPLLLSSQTASEIQQLKTADKLIQMERCDDAIAILSPLWQKYSHDDNVIRLLKKAYFCNSDYDRALKLLTDQLTEQNEMAVRYDYLFEIGTLYLKKGVKDSAEQSYQTAIEIMPDRPHSYDRAAREYMYNGYYTDAVRMFQEGRIKLADPKWFAKDLGTLYEIMRDYGEAAEEYFLMLARDTSQQVVVTGKIRNLISLDADDDFDTGLGNTLLALTQEYPLNGHAHRYYAEYLISENRVREAFDRYLLVDSLGHDEGHSISYFCKLAGDRGDHLMVEKGCRYLSSRYPGSPLLITALFTLANTYYNNDLYDLAINTYDQIVVRAISPRNQSEALFYIGYTNYKGKRDPQAALDIFQRLTTEYRTAAVGSVVRLFVADCHLALGRMELADSLYRMIPMKSLPQNFQEELLFRLGELKFYAGDYENARREYGKLMKLFPKSIFVNDCLRRIMLISEHPDMEVLTLKILSDALYAGFQFEYDSALVLYDKLKSRAGTSLGELSWLESGDIYQLLKEPKAALAEYDSLIVLYPESFYTPLAYERKGDVYTEMLGDLQKAKQLYESILLDYQNSLNSESVRKKLQQVQHKLNQPPGKSSS